MKTNIDKQSDKLLAQVLEGGDPGYELGKKLLRQGRPDLGRTFDKLDAKAMDEPVPEDLSREDVIHMATKLETSKAAYPTDSQVGQALAAAIVALDELTDCLAWPDDDKDWEEPSGPDSEVPRLPPPGSI